MAHLSVDKDMLARAFATRSVSAHKGNFGQAVIIGGSANYAGAPQFAAESAQCIISCNDANNCEFKKIDYSTINNPYYNIEDILESSGKAAMLVGCGTSVLAVPSFLATALYSKVKFSAIYPLKSDATGIVYDQAQISTLMHRATAFAVGMGAGDGETEKIVEQILNDGQQSMVIDADALVRTSKLKLSSRVILTPHIGEMSALLQIEPNRILKNPAQICKEYAQGRGCVILLKGAVSYVSDGERVVVIEKGNDKLAKGGSGDVLSGIIAGLLARSVEPFDAAAVGAYILGRCAEISNVNAFSHLPTDIIAQIPAVVDEVLTLI